MFAAILNEFLIAQALKTRLGGASDSDYEKNAQYQSPDELLCETPFFDRATLES